MKTLKSITFVTIFLFLFFTFSNYKSLDDVIQSITNKNGIEETLSTVDADKKSSEEIILEKAIIVDVIDGDTIKVEFSNGNVETIRLLLVDTPETVKPDTPEQPFGKEASDYMKKRLIKDTVVDIERGIEERDKYDRLLAYVYVNGKQINEELVKEGLARVAYVFEPNTKYLERLKNAETEAKTKGIGIWSVENYVTDKGFNH